MPKEITDLRQFLLLTRKPGVKSITIHQKTTSAPASGTKHVGGSRLITKFKLRRSQYLYTLKMEEKDKATKLIQSLPPNLVKHTSAKKKPTKK